MSKAKRETRREKVARKLNWKTTLRDVKGKETEAALEHKGEEASVEEIRGERQTKRNKNAESFSGASGGLCWLRQWWLDRWMRWAGKISCLPDSNWLSISQKYSWNESPKSSCATSCPLDPIQPSMMLIFIHLKIIISFYFFLFSINCVDLVVLWRQFDASYIVVCILPHWFSMPKRRKQNSLHLLGEMCCNGSFMWKRSICE